MRKIYLLNFVLFLLAVSMHGQSIVVPPNVDGTSQFPFTYLSDFIDADTAADGSQKNTEYLLERGGVYFFTSEAKWTFDVTLRATGDESKSMPLVSRANKSGGSSLPAMYRGFGSFTWDGIYIVLGDEGPLASSYETASFRPEGDDKTFVFTDCIIEKSRQGTIRIEGENSKTYITRNWIRNFGDYERMQGNGRIVDTRDNFADSVVIRDNVIHNILDRVFIGFRQKGLNYFEYSNNTLFNHVGRHGLIQLNNTKESVIKDNLFMNPSIMGTAPSLASEQISHANAVNYLFSIDTMVADASVTMSNNNVFWTQDVLDHYASFDSVEQPPILAPELSAMLSNPDDAYFTEVVALKSVPTAAPLIKYAREAVTYPDSTGITNIMVEDIRLAGTDYDKGNLFDFTTFDPCYADNAKSATAASDGGAVGVRWICDYMVSTDEESFNPLLDLSVSPNPSNDVVTFKFSVPQSGQVKIDLFNYQGVQVANIFNGHLNAGTQTITYDQLSNLPKGAYFGQVATKSGKMFTRVIVQ